MKNNKDPRQSYLDVFRPKQQDDLIETNVLIREEAEFLARNLVSINNDTGFNDEKGEDFLDSSIKEKITSYFHNLDENYFANLKKIDKLKQDCNESKILLEKIESLLSSENKSLSSPKNNEKTLYEKFISYGTSQKQNNQDIDSQLGLFKNELQSMFLNFEKQMNSIIGGLDDVISKINDKTNEIITKNEIDESLITNDLQGENPIIYVDKDFETSDQQKELMQSFEKLLNLKLDDTNSKIENLTDELKYTKDSFNNFINDYQLNLDTINVQQKDLNSAVSNNNTSFLEELSITKQNYQKIENEVEKVCSAWIETNKLLNKLENLVYEFGSSKLGYDEDLNALINEIKNQTIENKNSLLQLNAEIENVKGKVESLNEKQDTLFSNSEDAKKELVFLQKEFHEHEAKNIEKFSLIETELENDSKKIEELDVKVSDLMNIENFLDSVLSSKIFQKSLESKISNMICENNNYLGDEFKFRIDHIANKLDVELGDFKSEQKSNIQVLNSLESKVDNLVSEVALIDKKYNIKDQLEIIENKYTNLYSSEVEKIRSSINELGVHIDNFKLSDFEIAGLIKDSPELSLIIRDKIYQVIDEKIYQIGKDVESISSNIENKVKENTYQLVNETVEKEVSQKSIKIKNEVLNSIYNELTKRDKTINLHSQEITKNYEAMLKCNALLEELELLVTEQTEELDGLKVDQDNSYDLLAEKIASQKAYLSDLENTLLTQMKSFDFYANNESLKKTLGVWKNDLISKMIELVKSLVEDEIKKKVTISYTSRNETPNLNTNDDNFFNSRVKDILDRLDNEKLKTTFREKISNLNIKIDDLKQTDSNVEDDDLDWFYEKEYSEYVSSKKGN